MQNELMHYGKKGMRWGVRRDRKNQQFIKNEKHRLRTAHDAYKNSNKYSRDVSKLIKKGETKKEAEKKATIKNIKKNVGNINITRTMTGQSTMGGLSDFSFLGSMGGMPFNLITMNGRNKRTTQAGNDLIKELTGVDFGDKKTR